MIRIKVKRSVVTGVFMFLIPLGLISGLVTIILSSNIKFVQDSVSSSTGFTFTEHDRISKEAILTIYLVFCISSIPITD